jgi:Zn-dependent protease with chaperone function
MQKFSKFLLSLAIVAALAIPMVTMAQNNNLFGMNEVSTGLNNTLSTADPRVVVGRIINVVLGFLGVIAVGIILLGGFKWMTAGGNEDKVGEAKKLLGAGVIGLVIILSAWAIATFVINQIYSAVNN